MGKKTYEGEIVLFWIILDFESRISVKVQMKTTNFCCYVFIQFISNFVRKITTLKLQSCYEGK